MNTRVLTAVVPLLLAGCAAAQAQEQAQEQAHVQDQAEPAAGPEAASELAAEFLDRGRVPASQAKILQDGRVTRPEVLAAVGATRACIESAGVEADIREAPDGRGFSFGAYSEDGADLDAILLPCIDEHYSPLGTVWLIQQTSAEAMSD